MPAATAAFDEPLPLEARAPALLAEFRALLDVFRAPLDAFRAPLDVFRALVPELFDAELRFRDAADDLALLFPVLPLEREALDLLPLRGLDPFELRELVCRLLVERVLPWAIAPP
jgi:hypothetical protein